MASVHEQLSEQFHKWEQRGRGWQVFAEPVYPEPPFVSFEGHCVPEHPVIDDGRRPTLLSSFFQRLSRKLSTTPPPIPELPQEEEAPEPTPLVRDSLVEFQASLPDQLDVPRDVVGHFLGNFALCREPIVFEVLGTHKRVTVQFAAAADDGPLLHRQLEAYFSDAQFIPREGSLIQAWKHSAGNEALAVEFGLKREFMFPLASGKVDPFIGLIGALGGFTEGELGLFQVIFQPVREDWQESIMRSVSHSDGKPFFVNAPELSRAAEEKMRGPLFAAVVRILLRCGSFARIIELGRDLAASLRAFARPDGNSLIPLASDGYPPLAHLEDALRRQSRRSGMLLNMEELAGFVHLPGSAVRSAVLERQTGRTKAASGIVRRREGLLLGTNEHAGETVEVRLAPNQRVRHCHIIGASGTGKSTLLFNLISEDIQAGEGVAVLDPHGDLIDRILCDIPESRIDDVVLVNPADDEYAIGFNILSAHGEVEKNLLASDLVSVFRRLSTSWGDQMNSVLQNAILAFLESDRGGTIADLRRFLIEPPFRNEFLATVRDPEVVYYWQKSFPMLVGNRSIGSIITRLDSFLSKKPIRYMVSQRENRLDFGRIMDTGKIFLAKLPEGLLGRENSSLLGTLLISKFQQITMSRQAQLIAARRDFWIYIDEFANFITPSMAEILSGARKYRIGLTLAHHELHQLERDKEVASAVMTHPYTRIVFRVGDDDARKLADGFSFFEASDLRSLDTGNAVCRVERADYDFNLAVPFVEEQDPAGARARQREVIEASRKTYGTPRVDIEAFLAKSMVGGEKRMVQPRAQARPESVKESHAEVPLAPGLKPESKPPGVVEDATTEEVAPPITRLPAAEETRVADQKLHLAIKEEIGTAAEALSYTVTYEEKVADGGRIDVVLRRGRRSIACEVSVDNDVKYEVKNIEKCLMAGFSQIAVVAPKKSKLLNIERKVKASLRAQEAACVSFYLPDELIRDLSAWAKADPEGGLAENAKPHRQQISLGLDMSEAQMRAAEKIMLKELLDAIEGKKQPQDG